MVYVVLILDVNLVLDTPVNKSLGNTILPIVSWLVGSNSECQTFYRQCLLYLLVLLAWFQLFNFWCL